jgi:hypothetical protein
LLVTVSPAGGFEDVVEEFGEPTQEESPPLQSGAPDAATAERYAAVASKHGIEIVLSSSLAEIEKSRNLADHAGYGRL